jgi:para-nitrobenzyl esterase
LASNKFLRYGGYIFPHIRERVIHYYTKKVFEKPSKEFAILFGKAGGTVYTYDFFWQLKRKHTFLGAAHTLDTLALFGPRYYKDGSVMLMGMRKEEIIEEGKPLRAVWCDFARTGKVELREIEDMIRFD